MLKKVVAAMTIVSAIMLITLLFTTTPASAGPLGILGFFVFMYVTALGVLTFLLRIASQILSVLLPRKQGIPKVKKMSFQKAYYHSSVIASVPVMLIAIQSVGEVGIYQVFLIIFFVIIAWIFVSNRTIQT